MNEVKWIKITTDIFNDNKMKLIDVMPEADAIFRIWIGLLTLAGQTNNKGEVYLSQNMPYTDEMLATIFNRPINIIRLAINTLNKFGMIEVDEKKMIYISNWKKHQNIEWLERIKKQNKVRQQKFRTKSKTKAIESDNNVSVTLHNGTDIDKNKNKNRIDKNKEDKKEKAVVIKKSYGENNNVLLSDEQYDKLRNKFGLEVMMDYVQRLSLYIPNKSGKPYTCHYSTILSWERKNNKSYNQSSNQNIKSKFDEKFNGQMELVLNEPQEVLNEDAIEKNEWWYWKSIIRIKIKNWKMFYL